MKGHTDDEYNITAECLTCNILKNNTCVGTANCYECDEANEKAATEVREKLSTMTPDEKSKMFDLSDEELEKIQKEVESSPEPDSLEEHIEDEAKEIAPLMSPF